MIIWRFFRYVKYFGVNSAKIISMDKVFVGNNIKSIRKANNLTQKEFGAKLGYSARTVSDWELGNTEPDLTTIKQLVDIFDVDYEDIFE